MADRIYRGDAPAVAQVTKITPANVEVGDQFTLTINGKSVSFTATAATVANVTAGLVAAWNASTIPEFAEITASDQTTHVDLTADTAGVPFAVTSSTTNASSGNVTVDETTPGEEAVNEVQKIELIGTYTGGTFTLTWDLGAGNETTAAINYNASAADVQTAIEGLASVSAGDVIVTGGPGPSTPWFVTWTGSFAASEVNEGTIDGTNLTGNGDVVVETTTEGGGKSDEIVGYRLHATGGTYTASFGGETTSALNHNDSPATIQAALEALSTIGTGNVLVYGGGSQVDTAEFHFYVLFTGDLAGTNVGSLSFNATGLSGGESRINRAVVQTGGLSTRNEFQLLNLGQPSGGTFTLTHAGETTVTLNWNTTASGIRSALRDLSSIGQDDLRIWTGNDSDPSDTGDYFLVEFLGDLADTDVSALQLNEANLTGQTGSPAVTTIHAGGGQVNEVQEVTVYGTGGTFTLTFDGQTTAATAQGATAATVETNLEALSNITDVTVTGTGAAGDPYVVTFVDPGQQNVAEMTGDGTSLTGGGGEVTETTAHDAGTDEVQTVTIGAGVSGGTFTLSFQGAESGNIAYDATAATVETDLEALSTIDGVTVAGSAGGPWTVTFDVAPLNKQDVDLLVADGSNLVGGSGDETLTVSETTRSEGPNHFDSARNWSGNRVPDSADTLYLEDGDDGLLYGLRQRTTFTADASTDTITFGDAQIGFVADQKLRVKNSGGALPAGLSADTDYYVISLDRDAGTCQLSTSSGGSAVNITDAGTGTHTIACEVEAVMHHMRFSGDAGLPKRNAGDYYEYRPDYLEIGVRPGGNKLVRLGVGDGAGSSLLKIDTGDYQTELEIHDSGASRESGLQAVRFKNTNTSTNVLLLNGELAVAVHAGETSDINKLTLRDGVCELGNETGSVSLAEIDKTGGSLRGRNVTLAGNVSV